MKVLPLGGSHFVDIGGLELLLDCALASPVASAGADGALRVRLPALHAVDASSLDALLLSNAQSMLALPFLTEQLGFQGRVFATEPTLAFGRVLLEELALAAQRHALVFELPDGGPQLPAFSLADVAASCAKVTCAAFKQVLALGYGVRVTPLSSGFALGACTWIVESPSERFAFVGAASGDLNRHPREIDLLPLVDCDTLLLTDLKPERDPHASTERQVERVLASVSRVVDRGGVCVLPCAPSGVLFDLVEAVYAACVHNKAPAPMYLVGPHAARAMALAQTGGAEWLCDKKTEKLYAGESAFVHDSLRRNQLLHVEAELTASMGAAFQLLRMIGGDSRNAVLLMDPSIDSRDALDALSGMEIEKIVCPVDPRLSCGDANQLIARCSPKTLLVPLEFTVDAAAAAGSAGELQSDLSHFARVLPLHELTAAKPKTELVTVPMRVLEPVVLDKSQKYVDGKLDPSLAAKAMVTDVNGKAAACVSGVLSVKRKAFVLEALPSAVVSPRTADEEQAKPSAGKRKTNASSATLSPPAVAIGAQRVDYREKSAILLGQVDEDKLEKQVKAHDPQAQVYISQGQGDADVFMSIPSLDARVTLWKEAAKTLIETEKEESRTLLTSFVLAQLVVLAQ
ncbi:hypothetical protein PybrP1_001535 [[Pythium] brassicae (nom. inval.)]|nr:hypothetical protein PybrP1_001535 [[Pythium] brassicae (nom. inval.)]